MRHVTKESLFPFLHIRYVVLRGIAKALEVIIGMIADAVTCLEHLFEDLGVFVYVLPDHKEGSLDVIARQDLQHPRGHFRDRSVIESQIHRLARTENSVRVKTLTYGFEKFQISNFKFMIYHARLDAPRIAASESLRIEIETGILPFQIGIRFSSNASRIGSMIQWPDLVRPPKRMMASGLEKCT